MYKWCIWRQWEIWIEILSFIIFLTTELFYLFIHYLRIIHNRTGKIKLFLSKCKYEWNRLVATQFVYSIYRIVFMWVITHPANDGANSIVNYEQCFIDRWSIVASWDYFKTSLQVKKPIGAKTTHHQHYIRSSTILHFHTNRTDHIWHMNCNWYSVQLS